MTALGIRCYNHLIRIASVLCVAIVVLPAILQGQQLDNRTTGRTYVLAFPDTVTNSFDSRYPNTMEDRLYIYMYSAVDNSVTVTGNDYNRTLTVPAGKFYSLELTDSTFPAPQPIVTESGKVSNNVFRVEADQPMVVYCYMVTTFGSEAWTPIPAELWGNEYYAQAVPSEVVSDVSPGSKNTYTAVRKMAPAEILVVAAHDSTIISFTPGTKAKFLNNSQLSKIRLNRNEAYQIQSYADTSLDANREVQPDIAGTHITANKPIGVISGNTRAMINEEIIGLAKNSVRNMLMEWLAPVDQRGTEFVYMPTMDARRPTGAAGENLNEKRTSELVRLYSVGYLSGGMPATGFMLDTNGYPVGYIDNEDNRFKELRIDIPQAHYFRSHRPTQAFMTSTAVVKYLGTTGAGSGTGVKYDGWGAYTVEITPREQWMYAAPIIAPAYPANLEHKLNIVTDTASAKKLYWGIAGQPPTHPLVLNRPIKGTDLIWGDMEVVAGSEIWIAGWDTATGKQDTSVRFYGFVYGMNAGHEAFRPGKTGRKGDTGDDIASVEATGAEYEEYISVAYGYPLAPSRIVLKPTDDMRIDSSRCCCATLAVKVSWGSDYPWTYEVPSGLRALVLDSSTNAKIVFLNPTDPNELTSQTNVQFEVLPVDVSKNASAIVSIMDRAGRNWNIPYNYTVDSLNADPDSPSILNFGAVRSDRPSEVRELMLSNPMNRSVTITDVHWGLGDQWFQIIAPESLPVKLQPGEKVAVKVQFQVRPTMQNKLYEDSLIVRFGCRELGVKVMAQAVSLGVDNDITIGTAITKIDPNPLQGITHIEFSLARPTYAAVEIFDVAGQRVVTLADGWMQAGSKTLMWDANGVPAGVYYCRLTTGIITTTRTIVVDR